MFRAFLNSAPLCRLQQEPDFVFVVVKWNLTLGSHRVRGRLVIYACRGRWGDPTIGLFHPLRRRHTPSSLLVLWEPDSESRISHQKADGRRGGGGGGVWLKGNTNPAFPGGAAGKKVPSVARTGQTQAVHVCVHVLLTFMGHTLHGELRLVGSEPRPIGFQAQRSDL